MKKLISLLIIFTFGLSSCEKDDICDANTPTTPRLVLSFYENKAASVRKDLVNLKVVGEGKSEKDGGIVFNESVTDSTRYLTNANTISIPLKVDADTTTYTFIYDAENTNLAVRNYDVLTFHYTRNNVYVSRACGYKTIFTLNSSETPSTPYVLTDPAGDNFWIQRVIVQKYNIDNENETHVNVYF